MSGADGVPSLNMISFSSVFSGALLHLFWSLTFISVSLRVDVVQGRPSSLAIFLILLSVSVRSFSSVSSLSLFAAVKSVALFISWVVRGRFLMVSLLADFSVSLRVQVLVSLLLAVCGVVLCGVSVCRVVVCGVWCYGVRYDGVRRGDDVRCGCGVLRGCVWRGGVRRGGV